LHQIRDAVVQDANDSEGTGVWANIQAVASHVPAPSLTAAHYLRLASADVQQRSAINASIGSVSPQQFQLSPDERSHVLEQLRQAVYLTILVCFIQGFDVLARKDQEEGWGINMTQMLTIWRAGCIIKSDYLFDLFETSFAQDSQLHPLCTNRIADEVKSFWPSLKTIVLEGLKANAHMPCLSSTLEYLKYIGGTDLPTCFTEAQLDSFGAHGFDLKSEPVRHLSKGNPDSERPKFFQC
jgi:6-phosphogluconate dehydrogenase